LLKIHLTRTSDNAIEKGILHFYANLADDIENVRITSKLIDGEKKSLKLSEKKIS